MRKLNVLSLALTFAGCFLGAGYVSGQELWQFFGSFGPWGAVGLLLALSLLSGFGILVVRLAQISGCEEMDRLVVRWEKPWLRALVGALELLFLLGIAVIMASGTGALLQQLFALPHWMGSGFFCLVLALITVKGLQGMVRLFSATVPVLILCTLAFGLSALLGEGSGAHAMAPVRDNPLLGNWFVSALSFTSYNLFSSIGILAPLGRQLPEKKTLYRGVVLGGVFLLLIAGSVLLALGALPEAVAAELPMLALAAALHPALSYGYGFLLLCGMMGTAVSSLVAAVCYAEQKLPKLRRRHTLWVLGLTGLIFLGSFVGFGDLIGLIFPISGYLGMIFLVFLLGHFLWQKKQEQAK